MHMYSLAVSNTVAPDVVVLHLTGAQFWLVAWPSLTLLTSRYELVLGLQTPIKVVLQQIVKKTTVF